jgi:hypothetical protein
LTVDDAKAKITVLHSVENLWITLQNVAGPVGGAYETVEERA